MKHIYTILVFFCCSFIFAQDFKSEWKEVIQFELDGKIKSAHEAVNAIYKKAKRKKIDDQIIKCFFYQSKFLQVNDENYQVKVIENLTQEIKNSTDSKKAILNYVYVSILSNYYQNNRYTIDNRTDVKNNNSKDFKTWTNSDFQKEISKTFATLLKNEDQLHKTKLKDFESIFEISPFTDGKSISVYDFLQKKVIDYHFQNAYSLHNDKYKAIFPELIKNSNEFTAFKTDTISDGNLKMIIEIFQNNEKYCLKNNSQDIHVLQYNRMKKFYNYIDDKTIFFSKN